MFFKKKLSIEDAKNLVFYTFTTLETEGKSPVHRTVADLEPAFDHAVTLCAEYAMFLWGTTEGLHSAMVNPEVIDAIITGALKHWYGVIAKPITQYGGDPDAMHDKVVALYNGLIDYRSDPHLQACLVLSSALGQEHPKATDYGACAHLVAQILGISKVTMEWAKSVRIS